jgi:hypothetical protein
MDSCNTRCLGFLRVQTFLEYTKSRGEDNPRLALLEMYRAPKAKGGIMHRRTKQLAACLVALIGIAAHGASAETLKACDMTVDYALAPIEQGAPQSAAALQGVWVGTWDGGMCSALVVESISISGGVQAWYVYGRYTPWGIAQAGKAKWAGKMVNNKLSFAGSRGGADYTLTAPNKLDGLYFSSAGQFKGAFSKQ